MDIKCGNKVFDVSVRRSIFGHFFGMMFSYVGNDGLLFIFDKEKYVGLHMFFVFYNIDIVYIDKDLNVIKILKNVKPFTPHIKAVKCKYILELKYCKGVKIGDTAEITK